MFTSQSTTQKPQTENNAVSFGTKKDAGTGAARKATIVAQGNAFLQELCKLIFTLNWFRSSKKPFSEQVPVKAGTVLFHMNKDGNLGLNCKVYQAFEESMFVDGGFSLKEDCGVLTSRAVYKRGKNPNATQNADGQPAAREKAVVISTSNDEATCSLLKDLVISVLHYQDGNDRPEEIAIITPYISKGALRISGKLVKAIPETWYDESGFQLRPEHGRITTSIKYKKSASDRFQQA